MMTYFVTFRSVTFAQRGESVLHGGGIGCMLQRTPRWMEEQGCGYCLRVSQREISEAVALLRRKQVPFRKVYLRTEGGEIREVVL